MKASAAELDCDAVGLSDTCSCLPNFHSFQSLAHCVTHRSSNETPTLGSASLENSTISETFIW